MTLEDQIAQHVQKIGKDLILYCGKLCSPYDAKVIQECKGVRRQEEEVFLLLVTFGGDPHAAYRIGRCLHRNYKRVTVCTTGPCFSSGTLLAIAGHELVMTDLGVLGPLDIQIQKSDELFGTISGLTVTEAMDTVRSEAWEMLESTLFKLQIHSHGRITLKTALDAATALTVGALQPVFAQIDPMRLGEDSRSTRIIEEYGNRLDRTGENLKPDALQKLVSAYPSHQFQIDREEAETTLFKSVREPTADEQALLTTLHPILRPSPEKPVVVRFPRQDPIQSTEAHDARKDNTGLPEGESRTNGPPDSGKAAGNTS